MRSARSRRFWFKSSEAARGLMCFPSGTSSPSSRQEVLSHPGGGGRGGEHARRTVDLAVLAIPCTHVVNLTTCDKLVPDALDCVLVHADQFSQAAGSTAGGSAGVRRRSSHVVCWRVSCRRRQFALMAWCRFPARPAR